MVCRELRENIAKLLERFSSVFLIIIATDVKIEMGERWEGWNKCLKVYKKLIPIYVIEENNFF